MRFPIVVSLVIVAVGCLELGGVSDLRCVVFAAEQEPAAQGEDALKEANQVYQRKDYKGSVAAYREIIATEQDVPTKAKALFNLGLTYKQLRQHKDAIETWRKLIDEPVDDMEPGEHIMEVYRNYRPRAQWEIGNCYFDQGRYELALKAYRDTKKRYPFRTWCGTCMLAYQHLYSYQAALCREHLGDTSGAVDDYLDAIKFSDGDPSSHLRLVEIYVRAGQRERLNSLLDDMDATSRERLQATYTRLGKALTKEIFERSRPTATMRRELELRELACNGNRKELIKLLKTGNTVTGPPDDDGNWTAIRAAQLLANTPKESTVDLLAALKARMVDQRWAAFALAMCQSDDGIAWIRERARTEENSWAARSFIYCLSIAGPKGRVAITELERDAQRNLKWAIGAYRNDDLQARIVLPKYPEVKVNRPLPNAGPMDPKMPQ